MRAVKSADYRVESGQSHFSAHATETSQEASRNRHAQRDYGIVQGLDTGLDVLILNTL